MCDVSVWPAKSILQGLYYLGILILLLHIQEMISSIRLVPPTLRFIRTSRLEYNVLLAKWLSSTWLSSHNNILKILELCSFSNTLHIVWLFVKHIYLLTKCCSLSFSNLFLKLMKQFQQSLSSIGVFGQKYFAPNAIQIESGVWSLPWSQRNDHIFVNKQLILFSLF